MNISNYLIGIKESISINDDEIDFSNIDESGFNEDTVYGVDKIDNPTSYGLDAGRKATTQFANASDGKDTDIDSIFHDDGSGFNSDNHNIMINDIKVDPATIPAVNSEIDQFEDQEEIDSAENTHISDNELADDDVDELTEMFDVNGYDDLI